MDSAKGTGIRESLDHQNSQNQPLMKAENFESHRGIDIEPGERVRLGAHAVTLLLVLSCCEAIEASMSYSRSQKIHILLIQRN